MPDLRPGLPEEVRERLIALADAGEHVWQAVAAITLDLLAQPGVQKLRLYADVGACLGMKSAGVRAWCGVYQAVGDDLLVEFPQFRFTHWRVLTAAANRLKKPLVDLTLAAAASADNYGGQPVPPDVLAVQLGKPQDDRPALLKALERAGAAVVAAQRNCGSAAMLQELDGVAATLERLAQEAAAAAQTTKENSDARI